MNAIEMPARQMNATEYDRAAFERNFGLTAWPISYNSASQLMAVRSLTRQFHVDRAPLLLPSLARLHEYGALGTQLRWWVQKQQNIAILLGHKQFPAVHGREKE